MSRLQDKPTNTYEALRMLIRAMPRALTKVERAVLEYCWTHARPDGTRIFVGTETIVADTGFSRQSVFEALKRLDECGYLVNDGHESHGGRVWTRRRRIDMTRLVADRLAEDEAPRAKTKRAPRCQERLTTLDEPASVDVVRHTGLTSSGTPDPDVVRHTRHKLPVVNYQPNNQSSPSADAAGRTMDFQEGSAGLAGPDRSAARVAEFEAWFRVYPNKEDKPAALAAYLDARREVSAWSIDMCMHSISPRDERGYASGAEWLKGRPWR